MKQGRRVNIDTALIPYESYIGIFELFGILITLSIFFEVYLKIVVNSQSKMSILNYFLNISKVIFYGMLLFFTLFFNFQHKTVEWEFPKYITLSQLILAPIAAFEIISSIRSALTLK